MTKRPLYTVCLIFLVIRGILLMLASGESIVEIPASSIFLRHPKKAEVIVEGQVYKKTNTSNNQILYLKNNSLIHENHSFQESNILIYDDTFSNVSIGKTVRLKGTISSFEKARNPGNFDEQLYYAKQNIYGFVRCNKIVAVSGDEQWLQERLYQIRKAWKEALFDNMSKENAAVLSAMLLGEKSEIDADLKEQYQKAGISHVLAISGLHISFIGLGVYKLLRRGGLSYTCAGVLSVFFLSWYTLTIGFSVSVFRAYVMLILRIVADVTGRVYDMLTSVLLSAAILTLYQPLYLTDAAFYLSHGAILGVALILPQIEKILPNKKWLAGGYAGLAINIALFPVLLWFYFEIPVYSMLINLAVIPMMSWVLSLGMFGSLGCVIWEPIGRLLLGGVDILLTLFDRMSDMCCKLPFARVTFGKPNWWEVVIYYWVLAIFICAPKKKPKLRIVSALLSLVVMVIFIKFPDGKIQITMLDVGQGDCTFIKGPEGHTYLVDGGSSDVEGVAKYRIEPFLKSQGVHSLDYVFVSHGDADHYIGIKEMLQRQEMGVRIERLVLPANYRSDEELKDLVKLAIQSGVNVIVIKEGQSLTEGELKITCLHPSENGKLWKGNEGSMVLDICFKKIDILFTGDVEKAGEDKMLRNLPSKWYDILKVAHHGSKNSTSEKFLERIQPRIAWISAGQENSYGHPHTETLERLEKFECKVYQTSKYGAITVESDGYFIDIFPSSI